MLKHLLRSSGSGIKGDSWVATLGGGRDNVGRSVAVAPDGSVYVCGYTNSVGAGKQDFLLAKFSNSGTVQWQRTLGGSGDDYGWSVAVASDGSVYVCGYTNSTGAGNNDFLLAKFSSSGTVQWQRTLGGSGDDCGKSVAVAPDGSVYVCGYTNSAGAGEEDLLLAKFSSSGTVQWQKTFGSQYGDEGRSVVVAPDGSVYVCGSTYGDSDLLFAKFSSSGTVQWQKALGRGDYRYEFGYSVAVAPDGSVYVCGTAAHDGDLFLAKFSSSGTVQWQKALDGSNLDKGHSVAVAPDGSVYVCGYTTPAGGGAYNFLLAKFSSSGTVQWQKILDSGRYDYGYSVAVASDGSVYFCGAAFSDSYLLLAKITDFLSEQDTVTFGKLTFQDASLTVYDVSLTITSSSSSVSNAGLTVSTPSLTVVTTSLITDLYTL